MPISKINIVSFSFSDNSLLRLLASGVKAEFGKETFLSEGHIDLTDFFDVSRGQYKGNELLRAVDDHFSGENRKTLGLFSIDLFIPILTFIYGQAYLGGKSAIASSHRLSNTRYGLPEDPVLFGERLIKEAIHELGHTFGLIHCHRPECVMHSSTYVEEIDQKSRHLCQNCKEKMDS
jgi:archaemetzincin